MMTEHEQEITAARAAADRQIAHVETTIEELLIPDAVKFLAEHDPTDAWALLARRLVNADRPQFLAEALAVMVLRRVSDQQAEVRSLVTTWITDPGAFPDGAASVLERIAEVYGLQDSTEGENES